MARKIDVYGVERIMTNEQSKPEEMKIEIMFKQDRADVFDLHYSGTITPYQLLILASYFEFEGKYALSQQKAIEEQKMIEHLQKQQQIAKLRPEILKPS